ncbi:Tn3 family transposase [Nonomuraea sp. NPDC049269]|uniref:Tn3 family transposase n=1 Tax=Nonomuraea sp. NPDC049269 TaxID=3364349 RepID=UPI0037213586
MRMLQRDGNPTPLGDAIAAYGRIFKTLHILTYAVEEPYWRDIKGIRNPQGATTRAWRTSSARWAWCSIASRCGTPSTSTRL